VAHGIPGHDSCRSPLRGACQFALSGNGNEISG
jgi:hypothetical protein